jgi:putative oxidoreductase
MPKLILRYPDGVAGIALLLMRFSYASIMFPSVTRLWPAPGNWWLAAIPSAAMALAFIVGFATRAVALLLVFVLAADLLAATGEVVLFLLASTGGAGALALLGPGAYSVDAHRFGRRVIRVGPRSPDRGSAD